MDDGDAEDLGSLRRTVRRLRHVTWLKVAITLVIAIALVGHVVIVWNTARSLEMVSVRVTAVEPGSIEGDFTVQFTITLDNPTSGSIDVDLLRYKLYLEGEFIGEGEKEDFEVEPGEQELDFEVTFNALELTAATQDLLLQDSATLRIKGEATVPIKLFGAWRYTTVTVPFDEEEEVSAGDGPGPDPPPLPVLLTQPVYRPTNSAVLTWSRSNEADFLRYDVHYSTYPDFTPSEATRAASIQDPATNTHTVGGLAHLTTYYFIVRVYDAAGQFADSNRVSLFIP